MLEVIKRVLCMEDVTAEKLGRELTRVFKSAPRLGVEVKIEATGKRVETYFYVDKENDVLGYCTNEEGGFLSEKGTVIKGNPSLYEKVMELLDSIFEEPLDSSWILEEKRECYARFKLVIPKKELSHYDPKGRLRKVVEFREYSLEDESLIIETRTLMYPSKKFLPSIKVRTIQRVFLGEDAESVLEKIRHCKG